MGYPCVGPYILFYVHGPAILLCFWVAWILQNYSSSKWPLDSHLKMVRSQKLIRSLTHSCPYLPNKKKICFFLKCANKYSLVNGPKKIPWCYLMAMWSIRKKKFIDQLSCKISELMRKKWPTGGFLGFYNCEICHGLSLCETLYFVLYSWSSYFAFSGVKGTGPG